MRKNSRRTKEGPTIWEDHFLPEIVNPRTGERVSDGEEGELVFTSLTKEAMPVIRYRTRDLTRLLPGSVTAMRRIAKITGRSDDMLIIRGVNVFPYANRRADSALRRIGAALRDRNYPPNRLDEIRIVVEARAELADAAKAAEAALLAAKLKDLIGISAQIQIAALRLAAALGREGRACARSALSKEQALADGAEHQRDEYAGHTGGQAQGKPRRNQYAGDRAEKKSGQHIEVHVAQECMARGLRST